MSDVLRDGWLTSAQAAELVGVSRAGWWNYVGRGLAPQPRQHLGRVALWDRDEVEQWQASRRGRGWRKSPDSP